MSGDKPIYLDYNATTPLDPAVVEAMLPYLYEHFGNPSSAHPYGRRTRQAVEDARMQIAALLGCSPGDIIFTGSATESNNTVIKGVADTRRDQGRHIIISPIEHFSISESCEYLAHRGFEISLLPVDECGRVNPAEVGSAIRPDTILISVMLANNEIGTIQPMREIADIARQHGILIHSDASQAIGKIAVSVDDLGVDYLSVAGHKFYAPKGMGALYVRGSAILPRFMHGAPHESQRRAGTENVPGIVGLGAAAEIAARDLTLNNTHMVAMRDRLQNALTARVDDVCINGHPEHRLPNTLNISFRHVQANTLLAAIADRVAASAGAACHSDRVTLSATLQAIGIPLDYAMGTLRLSVGKMTTEAEIDEAAGVIAETVSDLRAGS